MAGRVNQVKTGKRAAGPRSSVLVCGDPGCFNQQRTLNGSEG